jgi:CubicO group peptidase (beta-lactamase class C family)
VVHLEAHGLADVEAGVPMTTDAIVRIYSMTKPITSVALMTLLEEGRFMLNEPVSKYVPELGKMKVWAGEGKRVDLERPITIQHLLTHTAGLAYAIWPERLAEDQYIQAGMFDSELGLLVPLGEMVRRLSDLPLAHQPGTVWRYSLAHDVLAHLVSLLAEEPFGEFLQRRIFEPLGMVDTGFAVSEGQMSRFSALYSGAQPGALRLVESPGAGSIYAGAGRPAAGGEGLVSTAADYVRFAQMLLNGGELDGVRILGRKTVERMTTDHVPPSLRARSGNGGLAPGRGYGLGVGVCVDPTQRPVLDFVGVYGWPGASGVSFWVDPAEELIGMILPQVLAIGVPTGGIFRNLVYSAIVD